MSDGMYLYHDLNETQKVTKEYMAEIAFKIPIILSVGDRYCYYPVMVNPYGDYGYVAFWNGEKYCNYYTAEYASTLTLKNTGNCRISYAIDSKTFIADLAAGESVELTNINSYVYCCSEFNSWGNAPVCTNCTYEYDGTRVIITPTGANATANLNPLD